LAVKSTHPGAFSRVRQVQEGTRTHGNCAVMPFHATGGEDDSSSDQDIAIILPSHEAPPGG